MRFYHFGYGYKNGREFGMIIGNFQARIARYQLACWWNHRTIFNVLL
jgi:hypothetical protein